MGGRIECIGSIAQEIEELGQKEVDSRERGRGVRLRLRGRWSRGEL